MMNSQEVNQALLTAQKNEITEHWVYQKLSQAIEDPHNRSLLRKIAEDELKHYEFWKRWAPSALELPLSLLEWDFC